MSKPISIRRSINAEVPLEVAPPPGWHGVELRLGRNDSGWGSAINPPVSAQGATAVDVAKAQIKRLRETADAIEARLPEIEQLTAE